MKRIFLALSSLAVIGISAQPSWAWLFHHCHGCKYSTYICCTPYNAFTPVCFGNINCCGCCPVANWGQQACGPMGCASGFDGGGYLGQLPAGAQLVPGQPAPGMSTVPFQAPMPAPAPGVRPMGYGGPMNPWPVMIQPTGYGPAYNPMYGSMGMAR